MNAATADMGADAEQGVWADREWDLPCTGSAWMEPEHLSSPAPWAGHLPFAAWIMVATRPRTLVELGVYSGISYLGFCQAAESFSVPVCAWGVDTWRGDAHAGHYGESVLNDLRARHDARYGRFSTLLQKTFDEALADVPDTSVDLLHIDGLHTYEAVRHDFEAWQGKLSDRAVVLFHDIEVRRDDFGVWRFWAEVRRRFASLEFEHSNGLGVLLVGPQAPTILQVLAADERRWRNARRHFRVLGERLELRAERMHLRTVVADLQAECARLHAEVADLQERERAQHAWIEVQDVRLSEAEQVRAVHAQSIRALQAELAKRDGECLAKAAELANSEQSCEALQRIVCDQQRQADAWQTKIGALQIELENRASDLLAKAAELADSKRAYDALDLTVRDQQRQIDTWQTQMAEVTRQARATEQNLQLARAQSHALSVQVQELLSSRSWRITAGLRKLGRLARRLRAPLAGNALVVGLRRSRNALRYAATGNWRELARRMRHAKQQAAEVQRLQQFQGQPTQWVDCGILATPHTWYVAQALQVALERAGLQVQMVTESSDGYPLDLYFVVCPQMFKHLPPGEKRIAFQMEQTVSSRWLTPAYLAVLENSLVALDYARTNIANLVEYDIVYPHVYLTPIGGIVDYRAWLGGTPIDADEHCEVLFYGDVHSPRRRRMLDAIADRFRLRVVGNAFGHQLHRALAGAKVVVNLHYYEGALLETTRIYECLSLGKPVVSEWAADQADHADLDDVVRFAPLDNTPALLQALEQALEEQSSATGRAAFAARCQAAVTASQARFEFMLYRMLLARRIIDYSRFHQLTAPGPALASRVALSLPETPARRAAFEAERPPDVAIFDGLRYSPSWVGCALSYKHLARSALSQGLAQIEIMEDDVEFPTDYDVRRARVQAYLSQRLGQWDVFVGVMALVHPDTRVLKVEQVDGETYVTLDRMISMVCNIYTPKVLQHLAAWDETRLDADNNTIDRFLQQQGDLRAVVTLPFLVGHREDMDFSLWGISNARYTQLISEAQAQIESLAVMFQQVESSSISHASDDASGRACSQATGAS